MGTDFMPLEGVDHLELWVGNATQAAYFYTHAMGFTPVAYAGLETGVRDRVSWVLEQGRVRCVVTAPLGPDGEIAEHVRRHGDGVRTVALAGGGAEAGTASAYATSTTSSATSSWAGCRSGSASTRTSSA